MLKSDITTGQCQKLFNKTFRPNKQASQRERNAHVSSEGDKTCGINCLSLANKGSSRVHVVFFKRDLFGLFNTKKKSRNFFIWLILNPKIRRTERSLACLSLSLSHTHTHTHTQSQEAGCEQSAGSEG